MVTVWAVLQAPPGADHGQPLDRGISKVALVAEEYQLVLVAGLSAGRDPRTRDEVVNRTAAVDFAVGCVAFAIGVTLFVSV